MTTFLTAAQRDLLIDWYVDCMEDMGEEDEQIELTIECLKGLNNVRLIHECVAFMPLCMRDLAQVKAAA